MISLCCCWSIASQSHSYFGVPRDMITDKLQKRNCNDLHLPKEGNQKVNNVHNYAGALTLDAVFQEFLRIQGLILSFVQLLYYQKFQTEKVLTIYLPSIKLSRGHYWPLTGSIVFMRFCCQSTCFDSSKDIANHS